MSVETDPVPPLPSTTPPINKKDAREPFENNWMQWFLNLRAKVNVLNQSLVSLASVVGTGILVKNGAAWVLRTITGTAGRISVTAGDGAAGDPTIDLINTAVTPGSYTNGNFTVGADGRLTAASNGSTGNDNPLTTTINPAYDMLWKPPTATAAEAGASYPWVLATTSGDASIVSIDGGNSRPGVWRLSTGTSTNAIAISQGTVANHAVGAGVFRYYFSFRVTALSDGVNTYAINIGLSDTFSGVANNRLRVRYTHIEDAGNIRLETMAAGVQSTANSGIPVVANTYYSGYVEVNAAGTRVDLYIGGASVANVTTNIPSVSMLLGFAIAKTAGATPRMLDIDFLGPIQVSFTTSR